MDPFFLLPTVNYSVIPQWQLNWSQLRDQVGGRLYQSIPFAQPCYDDFDSPACADVRSSYLDEVARSNTPTAFIQSQWETCQSTSDHCLLDWTNHDNDRPTRKSQCKAGSLPSYYIDVKDAEDVKTAFEFSRNTRVPLSIRNTGHDYKGRSSAPGSLGLWVHNLQNISYHPEFTPRGCSGEQANPKPAVTMGAGVRWNEAHIFADQHNITIVGGSDKSVGAVGGWLQGGGHGALSNTMGMGADRVLEFEVVTPDGQLRVVNECQNADLFWALRGGGGSTFGVVLSATVLPSPPVTLQTLILSWRSPNTNISLQRNTEAWRLFAHAAVALAEEGWGGYVTKDVMVLLNPKSPDTFAKSGEVGGTGEMWEGSAILSIVNWAKKLQASNPEILLVQKVFPSWLTFFEVFTSKFVASVGKNLAISSRLVPTSSLRTPSTRGAGEGPDQIVEALLHANTITTSPGLIILMTTPFSTPDPLHKTSVNPAWRESIWHVTNVEAWPWNATRDDIRASYKRAKDSLGRLREVTGGEGGAAYVNEADVHEEGWERAFWGEGYERLLEIKRKYDPDHLLDCWHCVGFERHNPRFGCYLDA